MASYSNEDQGKAFVEVLAAVLTRLVENNDEVRPDARFACSANFVTGLWQATACPLPAPKAFTSCCRPELLPARCHQRCRTPACRSLELLQPLR